MKNTIKSKNPATPRSIEEIKLFYEEYLNGSTIKEINFKYKTDAIHQFQLHNLETRNPSKTKKLREKLNIQQYNNKYKYLFESVENEIEAYILGFWFADGWVGDTQAGIKIHKNDIEIVQKMKNYISEDITLQVSNNTCGFVTSNEELLHNLINLGCVRNKTYKQLNIPNINSNLFRHFIRGYFDADGTIYKDRKWLKVNICSINLQFLKDISKILESNNIKTRINIEIREGKKMRTPQGESYNCKNMYRMFVSKSEDFKLFYEYLYKDSTIFLERKFIKFNNGNTVLTN
jgi:intein/homing endonuclease